MKSTAISLLLAVLMVGTAHGETLYVTDDLKVAARSGPGLEYRIVRFFNAGQALNILEKDTNAGYARIQIGDKDAWILLRQLERTPGAKERLAKAQKTLAALKAENEQLKQTLSETKGNLSSTSQNKSALEKENAKLTRELNIIKRTANFQKVDTLQRENEELQKNLIDARQRADEQQLKRAQFEHRVSLDWFIYGALVIIAGMVIGLVLPRLRVRKKSRWDNL